ncbi:molybdenum ABC transporter ATP-binding protein [Halomonas sp. HNIBRBA4712]|uniref:molybdenum ABC transporter ATP-binding protein n=1 Tax=Halomonas sp. HNIBRBA4712 TaxID=3373087 RepID=UPI0037468A22
MADSISLPHVSLSVEQRLGAFTLSADLTLPGRGVTGVFGPSGSGKTSLLRLIAGLDRPTTGRIALGDQVLLDTRRRLFIPVHRRRIGVVFQEARLFPHYSVRGNLTYGQRRVDAERFDDIVALLGIEPLLSRMPGTLSGGEARRVAIGRALLSEPRLLLMDEPLTGLDGARKEELLGYITRLTQTLSIPVIYVSHDADELTTIADHLVVMEAGRVVASDALTTLLHRFDLTRALGGFDAASRLEGEVAAIDPDYGLTRVALDDAHQLVLPGTQTPVGTRVRLRVHARDVTLALSPSDALSTQNQLPAVIRDSAVLFDAPHTVELCLEVAGQTLRTRVTRKAWDELGLAYGQRVTALIRAVAFQAL